MLKKIKREIKNFMEIFALIALIASPIFLIKLISILCERGVATMVSFAIVLSIWAVLFVLATVLFVKPWKKNKKISRKISA